MLTHWLVSVALLLVALACFARGALLAYRLRRHTSFQVAREIWVGIIVMYVLVGSLFVVAAWVLLHGPLPVPMTAEPWWAQPRYRWAT